MKRMLCLLFFLCFLLTGCQTVNSESRDDAVKLLCLNIGKADCMLLKYRDTAYLIDTGYEQNWPALETALAQYGIEHLNGVFLTHCHKDHMGGLMDLARSSIGVDAWYAARFFFDQKESKHPAKLAAAERNQEVTWLEAGEVVSVDDAASFTVLGPLTVNTDNENDNSLVMRFNSPQGSILFTGDMKEEEEYELLEANLLTPCDLLKVGHHGDNKATSKTMLQMVQPKAAIILTSTSEEPDTPANSTVKRLLKIGCEVYVSQEYHDAVLLTLSGGAVSAEDIIWKNVPERVKNVRLSINVEQDTVTIINESGSSLPLKDCMIYSTKGNELFGLPDVTVSPGGQYVIGTSVSTVEIDAKWQKKRVWNQNSRDAGILYDSYGRPVACADNGITD